LGANLQIVANFMEQPFSGEQRQLLQNLLQTSRHYRIKNVDVVIAVAQSEEFISGLDVVTYQLMEVENCDVVFAVASMQGKIHVVGRSRTGNVKVNEILKELGGRGHEKAAAAIIRGKETEKVVDLINGYLGELVQPALLARDIMSTPVKTIPMQTSIEDAGRIMLRYGHTGMPVIDQGKMVGVISRRDVDKAKLHNLGHAPVKGFMTTAVMSAAPDATVSEIHRIMVEYDIGRLPIIENNRLVGIVSRTDIIRTLHGEDYPDDYQVLYLNSETGAENCLELIHQQLPSQILNVLTVIGQVAEGLGAKAYCVGGFVRDLLLRESNYDVDIVVEGDGEAVAQAVVGKLGGQVRLHDRFQTAAVVLPDGTKIDIATARTEYYEFPAALPVIEKSSIKEDMYRRDFTINTMAISLNPGSFGDLIDYFGGRKDLINRTIRILYNLSFVEDPTRIIRAIRFEQRYGFTMEPDTLRFARDAIERRLIGKLSHKRILQELILILNEKEPLRYLERMEQIGVWKHFLPEINLQQVDKTLIKRIPIIIAWWEERSAVRIKTWLVYFTALISKLDREDIERISSRYHLDNYACKCLNELGQVFKLNSLFHHHPLLKPSQIDSFASNWCPESIVYLLLIISDEKAWNSMVEYLEVRDRVRVAINGHDLKDMGIRQGPYYSMIFAELYGLKLDRVIQTREEELNMVKTWIEEGRFKDAMDS
ncbi:MAG: CBS domain-containing protein, partial [Syntrophomonadaceae bacterium]|nr:CBS domain-containing protein [Syntrophomonadaceae bacterium]